MKVHALIGSALIALSFVAPVAAQNAAVVNNKPISKEKLDEFVEALKAQGRPDSPELRTAVREELIAREVFAQEAEKKGLARSPDVVKQMANVKQDLLIRALIRDHLKANPIKDADIKAEYDKVAGRTAGEKEYKARHILVEKEDTAKQIIADLKKGSKFEDLAKQSKDPGSAGQGGDLDWNQPGRFVKEFSEAMTKLEKGKFTEAPIKTQFGFHVIRLDDVRDVKAPPLDQVKPQIQQELERRAVQKLQADLRAKAKVE
jgi:peptidyl-prolyl cis-trans isomerase C